MSEGNAQSPNVSDQTSDASSDNAAPNRREAIVSGSSLLMAGGLIGGYGTFFAMAGRYFFPSGENKAWMFVANADSIAPGASLPFESPTGVQVTVTRLADDNASGDELTADSFLALSSVCPHLGCRVHWEPQNDRFFCPCHNGVFAPDGTATEGPPAADGQNLPQYPLMISEGALFIEMPYRSV